MKPFAAASIGQVHQGILKDGKKVAIKIQVHNRLYYMAEINAALTDWLITGLEKIILPAQEIHLARSRNSSCPLQKFILPTRENTVQIKF